jgi:membrane fusion protein (multidrug efflux system)
LAHDLKRDLAPDPSLTPVPFEETLRSLSTDHHRNALLSLLVAGVLLGAWLAWFTLAQVTTHAVSRDARLEVDLAPRRVDATHHSGRVVAVHMKLGRQVQAGDLLLEIEDDLQRNLLAAEMARRAALLSEVAAVEQQLTSQKNVLDEDRRASQSALEEAKAELGRATTAAQTARADAVRNAKLLDRNLVSARVVEETDALAREREATVSALQSRVKRIEEQGSATLSVDRAEVRKVEGKLAHLRGELEVAARAVDAQTHEVEHHEVRAPVAGRIAEMADIQAGTYVTAGAWIATIIPESGLRVVAHYPPSAALGRIRPGQKARLRLHGFPWPQYGTLSARVSAVAEEPRDGRVRVELALAGAVPPQLPAQHGLPGTLEIDLERISPAELALRAAGKTAVIPYDDRGDALPTLTPGSSERGLAPPATPGGEPTQLRDPFVGTRPSESVVRDEE